MSSANGSNDRVRSKLAELQSKHSDYNLRARQATQHRLSRRITRLMRKYAGLFILALILVAVWHMFGGRSEQSTDRRALSRLGDDTRNRLRGRRHRSWPGWAGLEHIFAFGDSHTDTGFRPGGVQPTHFNPLGNPYFPGRTANYGPNYLGHLTATFNESFIRTYNLARSGSSIIPRTVPEGKIPILTLEQQVEDVFLERYGRSQGRSRYNAGSGWRQDDTLFIFHAGTDDIVRDYVAREGDNRNMTEVEMMFEEYRNNLNKMYDYGARNFLIVGFPALEESPRLRISGIFNSMPRFGSEQLDLCGRLAFMTHLFAETHLDATVFHYDNMQLGIDIRNDPKNYPETTQVQKMEGFCYPYAVNRDVINTDDPACGVPLDQWYWRDEEHQTEPYHRVMARLIRETVANTDNALPYEFY